EFTEKVGDEIHRSSTFLCRRRRRLDLRGCASRCCGAIRRWATQHVHILPTGPRTASTWMAHDCKWRHWLWVQENEFAGARSLSPGKRSYVAPVSVWFRIPDWDTTRLVAHLVGLPRPQPERL